MTSGHQRIECAELYLQSDLATSEGRQLRCSSPAVEFSYNPTNTRTHGQRAIDRVVTCDGFTARRRVFDEREEATNTGSTSTTLVHVGAPSRHGSTRQTDIRLGAFSVAA